MLAAALACSIAACVASARGCLGSPRTPSGEPAPEERMSPGETRHEMTWKETEPGVWSAQAGDAEAYTVLGAAGITPAHSGLARMPMAPFPLDPHEIRWERRGGKTYLRFPLAEGERIYGLGLDFNGIRRNQSVQTLHVDAWSGRTGRTHAPVPFYVSSLGYGVLIDSARYLEVYVGTTMRTDSRHPPVVYDRNTDRKQWEAIPKSDSIEVYVPAAGAHVLVFGGPTPMDAVRRYNLYCGGGCLPPKWGLGFTQRVPSLDTAEQVEREAAEFEKRGFPLDFIGLEPGWQDHSYPCSFEWDRTRYPDPAGFVERLFSKGVRLNLWFNPYVSPTAPLYAKLRPYAGSHTVWNGIVPDYTLAAPREIFSDHLKTKLLALGPGIGGFKIDEVDGHDQWLWPDVATFPSGLEAEQLRQTYGLLLQRLTYELFHAANRRTYGLVRGSNAGASYLPYVLYSDFYAFDGFITALCNSGFSGILWTPEVRSAKSGEEWLRRIQAVCFSPMAMLNAWASGTEPWSYPEVEEPVRQAMLLRMRLLPYLYTTFAEYHFEGTPPIRPMPLVEGFPAVERRHNGELDDTTNPYSETRAWEVADQYMLGDSLLVAPIAPGQQSRTVLLPKGKWYDFYTGTPVDGGRTITVTPGLEHIPLFVRDGGIIPLIPERLHAPKTGETVPIEVRHYGDAPGQWRLYDDDGETFAYEHGAYTWWRLAAERDASGHWHGRMERQGSGKLAAQYGQITWKFYP